MFLIFDTYGGLCNQMYDIQCAINFCKMHNIEFSFRYACLREKNDLTKWYDIKFKDLFSDKFITNHLYIPYDKLDCNVENTHLFNNKIRCIEWLNKERALLPQLDRIKKKYIVLRQFWSIFNNMENENIYHLILPCKKITKIYNEIKKQLPQQYNYLHYRYEDDFIAHFNIKKHPKLCRLIDVNLFKKKEEKIYVAAYNIQNIPRKYLTLPIVDFKNIVYKNDDFSEFLNFEELAFIDFLIGKHALEVYGHSKSSFSTLLNSVHGTSNYYN